MQIREVTIAPIKTYEIRWNDFMTGQIKKAWNNKEGN